jgi:hypothetical protein
MYNFEQTSPCARLIFCLDSVKECQARDALRWNAFEDVIAGFEFCEVRHPFLAGVLFFCFQLLYSDLAIPVSVSHSAN